MGHKRKRSLYTLSSPLSDASTITSASFSRPFARDREHDSTSSSPSPTPIATSQLFHHGFGTDVRCAMLHDDDRAVGGFADDMEQGGVGSGMVADAWGSAHEALPSYLPSRTRKRWRDDRPDDEAVYESTLNILYRGAQHPYAPIPSFHSEATPCYPSMISTSASGSGSSRQMTAKPTQASLHAFWNLSSSAPSCTTAASTDMSAIGIGNELGCQDCDAPLPHDDPYDDFDIDLDTDIDIVFDHEAMDLDHAAPSLSRLPNTGISNVNNTGGRWRCTRCRRRVCDTCAVVASVRRCLECVRR